jgi:hypothetical protein
MAGRPGGHALMDSEAMFVAAVLRKGQAAELRLVSPEHFSPGWKQIVEWITAFVRQENKLPRGETINGYFAGRPPVGDRLPDAPEEPSFYASSIRNNAMRVAMEEGFAAKVVPHLADFKPGEALKGTKELTAEITRNFRERDQGLILPDLSEGVRARYNDYLRRKALKDMVGLPTAWPTITRETRGFRAGDSWGIAARPGVGKTWVMVVLATHLYQLGLRVLFCSMETPPQGALPKDKRHRVVGPRCIRCFVLGAHPSQECPAASLPPQRLTVRIDSVCARLSAWRLMNGTLTPREEEKLVHYYQMIENPRSVGWGDFKIIAAPAVRTVTDVEAEILDYGPDIVFWDSAYLGAHGGEHRTQKDAAAELVIDFNNMLKRVAIPGCLSWHFNRDVDEEALTASMNDLILTDEIGRVFDVLLAIFRTTELRTAGEAIFRSMKTRDGVEMPELKTMFKVKDCIDFREIGEPARPSAAPSGSQARS